MAPTDPDRPQAASRRRQLALFATFVAAVYGANWALDAYGVVQLVGPGSFMVPAGVYFAGLTFGLRDALHEAGGRAWIAAAVATGAVLSWWLSDAATIPGGTTSIAVASGLAFAASESADWLIYAPLRERNWVGAVVLSNTVGALLDSALFLWLAFGSLDFMEGQVVGKLAMTLVALPIVWWVRRR